MAKNLTHGLVVYGLLGVGAAGVAWAGLYASTPVAGAEAPASWPAVSLALDANDPTLVLFLHPGCACSRATLRELERAYASVGAVFPTRFVVAPVDGTGGELVAMAEHLAASRRVELVHDVGGVLADAFSVGASGEALVYDTRGTLRFHGGLTAARAHEGPNRGADAVVALMRGRDEADTRTPVFGCLLRSAR
ncbi:MAG: hypothetical protein RIT81_25210 [Deltaproteobacteria bacterium]